PVVRRRGGVVLVAEDRARADLAAAVVAHVRGRGTRVVDAGVFADHDGLALLSPLIAGELRTSSHPVGYVQIGMRPRLRRGPGAGVLAAVVVLAALAPLAAVGVAAVALAVAGAGALRARTLPAALFEEAS
ncbi:MAG: hypothetical protein ACTHMS_15135, partial [Jatrophihabitans sp.]|uniref:hypothetical protein n=1 Tax=Jatrophihabitans sp. TaxID=1932789 RepID=UPI003F7DD564